VIPCMDGGTTVQALVDLYYTDDDAIIGGSIQISQIWDFIPKVVASMVVQIYGSLGIQRIMGAKMMIVECVL
jgi:hypothetical protein